MRLLALFAANQLGLVCSYIAKQSLFLSRERELAACETLGMPSKQNHAVRNRSLSRKIDAPLLGHGRRRCEVARSSSHKWCLSAEQKAVAPRRETEQHSPRTALSLTPLPPGDHRLGLPPGCAARNLVAETLGPAKPFGIIIPSLGIRPPRTRTRAPGSRPRAAEHEWSPCNRASTSSAPRRA